VVQVGDRKGHVHIGAGTEGVFQLLIGADFDGDAGAFQFLALVLAEVEAEQANRPVGDAPHHALVALDAVFNHFAGGNQIERFGEAVSDIESRELQPAIGVPGAARADEVDVVTRFENDLAFVRDFEFVFRAGLKRLRRQHQQQFVAGILHQTGAERFPFVDFGGNTVDLRGGGPHATGKIERDDVARLFGGANADAGDAVEGKRVVERGSDLIAENLLFRAG